MKLSFLLAFVYVAYALPTGTPTRRPTSRPTQRPTARPTNRPTPRPTHRPTSRVTSRPTQDTASLLRAAVSAADARIRQSIVENPDIAATYLRLGFHDCLPNGAAGGCDGCLNLDNPANFGLLPAVRTLAPIVSELENSKIGFSRADIWALAVMISADASQNNVDFVTGFRTGRQNCETVGTCSSSDPVFCSEHGPDTIEDFPSTAFTTHELVSYFSEHFGYGADETVAIMGAHTIGRAMRENSGFHGENGWVVNRFELDNMYYKDLVGSPNTMEGKDYFQTKVWPSQRLQFVRSGQTGTRNFMTTTDISVVRDLSNHLQSDGKVTCSMFRFPTSKRCPAASTLTKASVYRNDNMAWLNDFRSALIIMMEKGL